MTFSHSRRLQTIAIRGPLDIVRAVMNWLESRAKRREITRLLNQDEWVLKDIGITRGDVGEALASSGDPSLNLQVIAAKRRFWTRSRDQL